MRLFSFQSDVSVTKPTDYQRLKYENLYFNNSFSDRFYFLRAGAKKHNRCYFSDIVNLIEGTFPERRITGKVVGVHDGDTATVLVVEDGIKSLQNSKFQTSNFNFLKLDLLIKY